MSIFGKRPPRLVLNADLSSVDFTADAATDKLTPASSTQKHGLKNGDIVVLSTTGTLPAGLSTGTDYWVISAEAENTFKLSTSREGSVINITDAGTGTHSYNAKKEYDLDFVQIMRNEPEVDESAMSFELLGQRRFLERGNFWTIELMMNLFKYSQGRAIFELLEFIRFKNKLVEIYLHRDAATPILADNDNPPTHAKFKLVSINPFHAESVQMKDKLLIRFKSTSWVYWGDDSDYTLQQQIGAPPMDLTG